MRRFEVDASLAGERVDKLLARLLPEVSRATIQRWIGEGRVRVDGRPCRAKDQAAERSIIEVEPGPQPPSRAEPDASVPFHIVYEDEHLVVVDKPAGVVVHPARGHASGTLVSGLLARTVVGGIEPDPQDPEALLRPGIVHRIDKDTSGLLVIAKTATVREALKALFARHDILRVYVALTLGVPTPGRIETTYGRDPRHRVKFSARVPRGRRAVTRVQVEEVLFGGKAARVELQLETGRTHQIRVHLSEVRKTPILADKVYGRTPVEPLLAAVAEELGRQALHARALGFKHPVSGEFLEFESPLPADMAMALERLRSQSA